MIGKLLRGMLAILFLFSAFFKLWDMENTIFYFAELLSLSYDFLKVVLLLFSILELFICFSLCFASDKVRQYVYLGGIALLIFFIIFSLYLMFIGAENCGCFGTDIVTTPFWTIVKDLVMIAMFAYLWKSKA